MSKYTIRKALRVLDHAIEHLGPTKPCGLLICDGSMGFVPANESPKQAARTVLAQAMCDVVRELR